MARQYELKRRAERQAETRRRIVEAAVALHTTVGMSRTSVSAIAQRAGVQRHTVYAHFPDQTSLLEACSGHWRALHPFPDVGSLELRRALDAVYRWYEQVEDEYAVLARDLRLYPELWAARTAQLDRLADALAKRVGRRRVVRAAVGHALEFETWRSLCRRQGLSRQAAVEAMVRLVANV